MTKKNFAQTRAYFGHPFNTKTARFRLPFPGGSNSTRQRDTCVILVMVPIVESEMVQKCFIK
mgnify:FL=1